MEISEVEKKNEEEVKAEQAQMTHYLAHHSKYYLSAIEKELKKGKTIDDLKQEVIDKKSNLTKSQRDFLIGWQTDFINEMLDIVYGS